MKKIAVGTLIALTAVLMIAAVPVYAQDGTPPDMPEGRGFPGRGREGGWAGQERPFSGEPQEALAEQLGMTVEELQAELDAGKTPRDLLEEAGIEPGRPERPFNSEPQEVLAERLGMTVEELQAELDAGKTPRDLMEEAGIEPGRPERPFNGAPLEELAEQLGMTVEELQDELEAGNTPHDLLEAAGIEPDCDGDPIGDERQGKRFE